jgi:hypothetical protein
VVVVDVVDDRTGVLDVVDDPTGVLDVLELDGEVVVGDDVDVVAGWVVVVAGWVVVVTGCVVVVERCGLFGAAPDWPAVLTTVSRTASAVMAATDGLRRWSRCGTATRYFGDGERVVGRTARSRLGATGQGLAPKPTENAGSVSATALAWRASRRLTSAAMSATYHGRRGEQWWRWPSC